MITPVTNTNAMSAGFALNKNQGLLQRSLMRLATGKKINAGKDDPAGLISSEQLAAAIVQLEAETKSLQRADSNATITDGHLSQVGSMLNELQGLVVASANTAGMSDEEIAANQMQIDSIVSSIQRFGGDAVSSLDGFNMPGGNDALSAAISSAMASLTSLRSGGSNDLGSGNFDAASSVLDSALSAFSSARGTIGAFQKYTVETSANSNAVTIENLTRAKSQILDTDYAIEMSNLTKYQILTTSGMKVLGIAQQQAKSVLSLLA